MKFGIFDYIDDRGEPLQKTYEERLLLLRAAEAAGFYGSPSTTRRRCR
jgi:hypothetical protein